MLISNESLPTMTVMTVTVTFPGILLSPAVLGNNGCSANTWFPPLLGCLVTSATLHPGGSRCVLLGVPCLSPAPCGLHPRGQRNGNCSAGVGLRKPQEPWKLLSHQVHMENSALSPLSPRVEPNFTWEQDFTSPAEMDGVDCGIAYSWVGT